jgi:nitrogen fixation/metabolism regulation signal transduction histidine kinase
MEPKSMTTLPKACDDPRYATLVNAFEAFQQQSQQLEESHEKLKEQLKHSQIDVAEKNKELAKKVTEVQEIKERLFSTLESITDAVFMTDKLGAILNANHAACKFFENESEDELSPDALMQIPEIKKEIKAGKKVQDKDLTCTIHDEEKVFMLSILPIKNSKDKLVIILKDITEYHFLKVRVEREDRMTALGTVAASVAHEIRNPLAAVEGFARLLERDLPDHQKRMAGKIVQATRQLNYVVTNLLTYTRDQAINPFPHDVCQVIEEAAELVIPMANDRDIEFTMTLKKGISAFIDGMQIKQLLLNLFINAVQACPVKEDGAIWIEMSKKKNKVVIKVRDNGCGIPANKINHLFEPFFTMKDGGIGLGLAMCRRIADMHNGSLTVTSTEGQGTCFSLELNLNGVDR